MSDSDVRRWQSMTPLEATGLADEDPVVILPLAAVEQHGPHLPLSTDLEIGLGLLEQAFSHLPRGFPAWVLPPQAVGTSGEHRGFPGTLSIDPELLCGVLHAVGSGVARCGIRRLVISNSHGGNVGAVDAAGLRLRMDHGLLVVKSHYFLFPRPPGVELPEAEWRHGLHGGAVETAMMLHLCPDLVRADRVQAAASLGETLAHTLRHVRPDAMGASFSWLAQDLNTTGVTGDSTLANALMGQRLVEAYGRSLAEVIQDARDFPIERLE